MVYPFLSVEVEMEVVAGVHYAYMALINRTGASSLYLAQYGGKTGHSTLEIKGTGIWYPCLLYIQASWLVDPRVICNYK